MHWPPADLATGADLVRRLLASQHPDLAELPLELADAGWDNVMWRLGSDLAVRVPRRAVAAPLAAKEQRWLPELAPRLPLPVPVPVRAGRPDDLYPWPWSVVRWLDGDPGDRCQLGPGAGNGSALGGFLLALHTPAPPDAPWNPYRSVTLPSRSATFEERMAHLADRVDGPALREVWESGLAAGPRTAPAVWIHADLHPANTLVAGGRLAAVIDFGDLCAGDPATDVASVWMTLPPGSEPEFWAAYGSVSDDLLHRARGWAVLFGLMLLEIGLNDRPTYEAIGSRTLDRLAGGRG